MEIWKADFCQSGLKRQVVLVSKVICMCMCVQETRAPTTRVHAIHLKHAPKTQTKCIHTHTCTLYTLTRVHCTHSHVYTVHTHTCTLYTLTHVHCNTLTHVHCNTLTHVHCNTQACPFHASPNYTQEKHLQCLYWINSPSSRWPAWPPGWGRGRIPECHRGAASSPTATAASPVSSACMVGNGGCKHSEILLGKKIFMVKLYQCVWVCLCVCVCDGGGHMCVVGGGACVYHCVWGVCVWVWVQAWLYLC